MLKVNGIWFGYGNPDARTWMERVDLVEARLTNFCKRRLSLPGKIMVINRFIVPLLWYSGSVIAVSEGVLVRLERLFFEFIWGTNRPNLVKRSVLYGERQVGGRAWFGIFTIYALEKGVHYF